MNISDALSSAFDDSDQEHMRLLRDVYTCFFPDGTFSLVSAKWKEAGWQEPDPRKGLKTSGILALQCIRYMHEHNAAKFQQLVTANKGSTKTKYPFAVVAVNVTLVLAELLSLKNGKVEDSQIGCLDLFADEKTFFYIFVTCFMHLDSIWRHRAAVRSQFGSLIHETKILISQVLSEEPRTLEDFQQISEGMGMVSIS